MEWIILVAGILGLGAIFGNAVTSERDHTSQGLSEEPTGKVVSLQSYQQRNADYHAEQEEEMIRLHEETVQRELIEQNQYIQDEQQRLFQEQVNEQQRIFDEQTSQLIDQGLGHSDDMMHSFSNPYTDVGTDINTDIHYHGVVDDPLETLDEFDSYDDYANDSMDTWHDPHFDDHY